MAIKLDLDELALKFDIDLLRVTTAEPFEEGLKRIKKQIKSEVILATQRWKMADLESFCNPRSILPTARSIIVAAECYLTSEPEDFSKPGEPHGLIARYAWRNYYLDLKKRLEKLAKFLKRNYGGNYRIFSNGRLAEKPMAQRSGLGYYGKHGIILSNEFGSRIVLGEIITDLEINPQSCVSENCGECRICLVKCPTQAIVAPYVLDWEKCFQYLTNWRGSLPEAYRKLWGKRLYGCTTCQDVCPRNKIVKPKERIPIYGPAGPSFPLIPLIQMGKKEYFAYFKQNQMGRKWINFDSIRRNAIIALGNAGDPAGLKVLRDCTADPDPMIQDSAVWAITRLRK